MFTLDDKQPNGFSINEMSKAFDRVKNRKNWKNPISKGIRMKDGDEKLITEAVIWFTGSVPTYYALGGNAYIVRALGYYLTIGDENARL